MLVKFRGINKAPKK
jgi:virulence-associated protein VapD